MANQWTGLAGRLEAKFGKGDAPILSRRLYRRCEVLCDKHGDRVYLLVVELAEAAAFADFPGKWFRAGIMRALLEEGFVKEIRPRTPAGERLVNNLSARVGENLSMASQETALDPKKEVVHAM